jgi:hypothetical protein
MYFYYTKFYSFWQEILQKNNKSINFCYFFSISFLGISYALNKYSAISANTNADVDHPYHCPPLGLSSLTIATNFGSSAGPNHAKEPFVCPTQFHLQYTPL